MSKKYPATKLALGLHLHTAVLPFPINNALPALLLLLSLSGCSDAPAPADSGVADMASSDRLLPPDGLSSADGKLTGNVGDPCTTDKECTGQAECLLINDEVGLCSLANCVMEDINTPEREDNCPVLPSGTSTVCTEIPVEDDKGGTINMPQCLPKCTPEPETNPCAEMGFEGIACDPLSLLLNGHSEVCLFPACKTHEDCGNKNPANPNALCIPETGTCQNRGKDEVIIGSPCTISTECGPGQFCFSEFTGDKGETLAEGGYCTKIGCAFEGPWTCPEDSKCFSMTNAMTLCLATGCSSTEPPEANGCRDEATAGQYSCIKLGEDEVCWLDLATE